MKRFGLLVIILSGFAVYSFGQAGGKTEAEKRMEAAMDKYEKAVQEQIKRNQELIVQGKKSSSADDYRKQLDEIYKKNEAERKKQSRTANNVMSEVVKTYFERAYSLASKDNYEVALLEYNSAVELAPEIGLLYFYRAFAHLKLNNADEAIKDYSQAIKHGTNLPDSYNNRGTLYLNQRKYQEASADFEASSKNGKNDYKIFYNRGLVQYLLRRYQTAYLHFLDSYKLNSKDADTNIMLGYAACQMPGWEKTALKFQENAIKLGAKINKGCR